MITLSESPQEIFDKVYDFLMAQGRPSWDAGLKMCRYRSPCDHKCAIGALIPDAAYRSSFEGHTITELMNSGLIFCEHKILLKRLQCVHDSLALSNWNYETKVFKLNFHFQMSKIANEFGLKIKEISNVG